MTALAVKHDVKTQGSLVSILPAVIEQPYSYSKNRGKLANDHLGANVYVIETSESINGIIYKLGYRYKLGSVESGSFCGGKFKFKNLPSSPFNGFYFDSPVLITNRDFVDWYKKTQGMIRIKEKKHVDALDAIINNPANHAKPF